MIQIKKNIVANKLQKKKNHKKILMSFRFYMMKKFWKKKSIQNKL